MPVSDKACRRKRLKRKECRRRVHGSGDSERKGGRRKRDRQVPQISFSSLATSKEGQDGSGRAEKRARQAGEDSVPVWTDERGDAEEREWYKSEAGIK